MTSIELARFLLTAATLLISGAPLVADLNKTHATNPLWTGHARFHVVWQVLTYGNLGLINLYLIWIAEGREVEHLSISCAILFAIIVAFYSTAFNVKRFGGAFYDTNGYLPFARPTIFGRQIELDVNAVGFSAFTIVLITAAAAIYRASV